jgi:hypothetical protein
VAAVLELAVVTAQSPRIVEPLLKPEMSFRRASDHPLHLARRRLSLSWLRPVPVIAFPRNLHATRRPKTGRGRENPLRREATGRSQEGGSTIAGPRPGWGGAKGLTVTNLVRLGRRASVASENCLTHGINEPVALLRPLFAAASVKGGKE